MNPNTDANAPFDNPTIELSLVGWRIFIASCLSLFILAYNFYMMTVAMPEIVRELQTVVSTIQGALITLGIVTAALVPTSAAIRDMVGSKMLFVGGALIYGFGVLVAASSNSIWMLILGYSIISGVGAVPLASAPWNWVTERFRGQSRQQVLSTMLLMLITGGLAGTLLGGLLVRHLGWRWAFAPQIITVMLLLWLIAPASSKPTKRETAVDWLGSLLTLGGLAAILIGISFASEYGWWTPRKAFILFNIRIPPFALSIAPTLIAIGIVLLGTYIFWRRRHVNQEKTLVIRAGLLRQRNYMVAVAVGTLTTIVNAGFNFTFFIFVPGLFHTDSFQTGLTYFPYIGTSLVVMLSTIGLGHRVGQKYLIRTGLIIVGSGMAWLYWIIDPQMSPSDMWMMLVTMGIGAGLIFGQIGRMALTLADEWDEGVSNGIYTVAQDLGFALAVAIFGTAMLMVTASDIVGYEVAVSQIEITAAEREELVLLLADSIQTFRDEDLYLLLSTLPHSLQVAFVDVVERAVTNGMRSTLVGLLIVVVLCLGVTIWLPYTKDNR